MPALSAGKNVLVIVHLIADYGQGDLAFAEVRQRLAVHLPDADVVYTPVPPFDTLSAGFCSAQLALTEGPADRLVYSNVAPRFDLDAPREDNDGEGLVAARMPDGSLVVGANSTYAFSFLRDEADELVAVEVPPSGSQFRSRDAFPALLPRLLARDATLGTRSVDRASIPAPPESVVAYVDGYGNLKTTWSAAPAPSGTSVAVAIGGRRLLATVSDGTFDVPAGEMSFAPGSSGWAGRAGEVRWYELLLRGRSAAEAFGFPAAGARVEVIELP
ncbi:hypothetical protein [Motilibacter deserti]|uniref:hypothetical protein n=1 Tax=Motilibacter deserti TaxID=2714956 RepID=UPI002F2B4A49